MKLKRGGLQRGLNVGICTCGAELRQARLPEFSGTSGGVRIVFSGLPCLECQMGGHIRIYPYWAYSEEEFYNALFDWFFNGEGIQWPAHSVEKGFLRTKNSCSDCDAVLDNGAKEYKRFESRIDPKVMSPFEIAAEVPIVTCSSCGLQQVYGDPVTDGAFLNQLLRQTIIEAFATVHLEP